MDDENKNYKALNHVEIR